MSDRFPVVQIKSKQLLDAELGRVPNPTDT